MRVFIESPQDDAYAERSEPTGLFRLAFIALLAGVLAADGIQPLPPAGNDNLRPYEVATKAKREVILVTLGNTTIIL